VLLVFGAPCQLRLLAGQEHGRTIPLVEAPITGGDQGFHGGLSHTSPRSVTVHTLVLSRLIGNDTNVKENHCDIFAIIKTGHSQIQKGPLPFTDHQNGPVPVASARAPLAAFVRRKSGINKCAERFTRCLGRRTQRLIEVQSIRLQVKETGPEDIPGFGNGG
jgi:hypothetical protein